MVEVGEEEREMAREKGVSAHEEVVSLSAVQQAANSGAIERKRRAGGKPWKEEEIKQKM